MPQLVTAIQIKWTERALQPEPCSGFSQAGPSLPPLTVVVTSLPHSHSSHQEVAADDLGPSLPTVSSWVSPPVCSGPCAQHSPSSLSSPCPYSHEHLQRRSCRRPSVQTSPEASASRAVPPAAELNRREGCRRRPCFFPMTSLVFVGRYLIPEVS